jgi:hypothetical protein
MFVAVIDESQPSRHSQKPVRTPRLSQIGPIWLELYCGIKSELDRIRMFGRHALDSAEENLATTDPPCFLPPHCGGFDWIWKIRCSIDKKHRLPFNSYVPRIPKSPSEPTYVLYVILRRVTLLH